MFIAGFISGMFLLFGVNNTTKFTECKKTNTAEYCKAHSDYIVK